MALRDPLHLHVVARLPARSCHGVADGFLREVTYIPGRAKNRWVSNLVCVGAVDYIICVCVLLWICLYQC